LSNPPLAALVELLAEDVGDPSFGRHPQAQLADRPRHHATLDGEAAENPGAKDGVGDELADEEGGRDFDGREEGVAIAAPQVGDEGGWAHEVLDALVALLDGRDGGTGHGGEDAGAGPEEPQLDHHPKEERGTDKEEGPFLVHSPVHLPAPWLVRAAGG